MTDNEQPLNSRSARVQRPLEWMRFDPVKYSLLCDGLTFAQIGALTKVMLHLWQRGPMLEADLQRIAKGEFPGIVELFSPHGDGLSLDMIEEARAYGRSVQTKASVAGKASAVQRSFNKRSTRVKRTLNASSTDAEQALNGSSTDVLSMSSSVSQSSSESASGGKERARAPEPDLIAPDAYADAWNEWLAHRREIRKPMTIRSQRMQLNEFVGWTPERIITAIRHSIANGWQGIFEPKQQHHGQSTGQVRPEHLSAQDRLRMALEANALHHASIRNAGGGDGA